MSGDALRIRSTMSVTVFAPWTVAVGLFGIVEEDEAGAACRRRGDHRLDVEAHRRVDLHLGQRQVVALRAKPVQFSNVGSAVTSAAVGDDQARIALLRISCEPAPRTMFSGLTLYFRRSPRPGRASAGELLNG